MGDHRSNSADSRTFGPVEIDQVIGRAWLRYWPLDTFGILPDADLPESRPGRSLSRVTTRAGRRGRMTR